MTGDKGMDPATRRDPVVIAALAEKERGNV